MVYAISSQSMRRYSFYLYSLLLAMFINKILASSQNDVSELAKVAIKNANFKELARFFNDGIEIGFDGEKSNYGKAQAEFVVRDFFRKHPPTDFEYTYEGASKEGQKYAIGKYKTTNGIYRITLYIKPVQGQYLIDSIDFTKE